MKLKALLVTMLAAGMAASLAVASPPSDRGREGRAGTTTEKAAKPDRKPPRESEAKRGRPFALLLHGEFVSASGDSFAMVVKKANRHGRALRGKQLTVAVDERTKVRRLGPAELSDLVAGDRVLVLARARKGETGGALELLARLVQAKPKREDAEQRKPDKTGSTSERTKTQGSTTERTKTGTTTSDD